MTGKDLIDYITNNSLENAKIVLVDWYMGTVEANAIEHDEETNAVKIS